MHCVVVSFRSGPEPRLDAMGKRIRVPVLSRVRNRLHGLGIKIAHGIRSANSDSCLAAKHVLAFCLIATLLAASPAPAAIPPSDETPRTFVVDFGKSLGKESPRVGFLGGLRDDTPDELIVPLHPSLWRIGHQFNGRIAGKLPAAVQRVQKLGAKYKLVMSDLIGAAPKPGRDWPAYEDDVKSLVKRAGDGAADVIWEPENEPDTGHKDIAAYYELYGHAFKALREADKALAITGPSFAFPTYMKYKAFLDYCKEHQLECNYLCWHYTGWDASSPEQQKWQLGKMPEFIADYPEQKIREIHCDEWGAGPDKPTPENPGRLQPGRAVVWFYYLEDVYKVDRACRANWGKADDYLGGIITPNNEPYPAYHAYRFYGSTIGMERATVEGNDREMAVLAHRTADGKESQLLLGSVAKGTRRVTLELHDPPAEPFDLDVRVLPGTHLDTPITESQVPESKEYKAESRDGVLAVTLEKVQENEAYWLRFTKR
jgi:hypothetical protein